MANPFETTVFNPLQALMLGQQSYASGIESNKKQAMEAARNEAGQLYAAGDVRGALNRLLMGGDLQGAGTYSGLDQNAWARQHTEARDKVVDARAAQSAGLAERQFAFQREQAREKPSIQKIKDEAGNEILVRVLPDGSHTELRTSSGGAGGNPFGSGNFNEGQGKAAGFTDRMLQSEGILRSPSGRPGDTAWLHDQGANFAQTRLSNADKTPLIGGLIGGVSNYAISEDRQKYDQAKRDFINAQLRRESGAVISPEEFASADKQYFPIPGDTQDVINQKAKNRRAAVEAMGREGGKSYRPKSIYTADGRVVLLPKVGEMKDGYRFKGGDPADPNSWVKAQ